MIQINKQLESPTNKPILYDVFSNPASKKQPLVVFCHGYKGFKDWGAWHLVAKAFMKANCCFVKFNFTHNGGTIEQPIDFPDLNAFAENNYTKELTDLKTMVNFLLSDAFSCSEFIDKNNVTVIGHSRGGGIASIFASEDSRVTKLITWASICDFGKRTATISELDQWRKDGVKYVLNGRTKQQMPHNYQFYEDYKANKDRLNIEVAVKALKIPHLIIHAKDDPSVKFDEALCLQQWNPNSQLITVDNANHVFNAKHPWDENDLPEALQLVADTSVSFVFNND